MMGVEGEESEEKIPRAFIMRVDDFNRESEAIFSEFEAIKEKYKRGEDVMADLKRFRSKRPGIFTLIDDLYHKEVEFEDKLERAQIDEDKRQKMLEFKQRFAELADEIDLLVLGELVTALREMRERYSLNEVISAGIGDFLIKDAVRALGMRLLNPPWNRSLSAVLPAYAVAKLLEIANAGVASGVL